MLTYSGVVTQYARQVTSCISYVLTLKPNYMKKHEKDTTFGSSNVTTLVKHSLTIVVNKINQTIKSSVFNNQKKTIYLNKMNITKCLPYTEIHCLPHFFNISLIFRPESICNTSSPNSLESSTKLHVCLKLYPYFLWQLSTVTAYYHSASHVGCQWRGLNMIKSWHEVANDSCQVK